MSKKTKKSGPTELQLRDFFESTKTFLDETNELLEVFKYLHPHEKAELPRKLLEAIFALDDSVVVMCNTAESLAEAERE